MQGVQPQGVGRANNSEDSGSSSSSDSDEEEEAGNNARNVGMTQMHGQPA